MIDTRLALRILGRLILVAVLLGMYAPLAMIVVYSFNESRLGSVWTGFSPRWYGELMRRRELWDGLRMSLQVGLCSSTLSVTLGALAAWGLRTWRPRPRRLAVGLIGLPLVAPEMIMGVSLAIFFHAMHVELSFATVVAAHVAFGLSYAFVVVAAAVADFDPILYDAALDCGATPAQAIRRVVLPILAPSLIVAWLFVFALSFDDFLITFFTKGPGTDTLPIKIYSRMRFGVRPDTNALFTLLFVATLVGACLAAWLSRRRGVLR